MHAKCQSLFCQYGHMQASPTPSCWTIAQVRLAEGDKWQDVEYLEHTSLKTYMPYMMGGGYVLSADLAHVILGINQQVL
jgi:hypothetical protein